MTGALLAVAAALLIWPAPAHPVTRLAPARGTWRTDVPRRLVTSPWAAASVAAAVGAVLSTPLVAVLAAGCTALGNRALERRRRGAAADARLLGLAEALGVLAAELRAGRPLPAAAASAAAACPDPHTRQELARALGPPVDLSLRTGCSLAAVAGALEDDLRAQHRQRIDLRTATAGPRASAAVLAGLPVLGLAMGAGIGADPWRVLTTTGPGQLLLVAGLLLEVAGIAWAGRLTRRALPEPATAGRRG